MSAQKIIDLFLRVESLKRLGRSGWDIAGVQLGRQESVAEHSWGTAFLSLVLSQQLSLQDRILDMDRILMMATVHDLAESLTSDIPRSALDLGKPNLKIGKSMAEDSAIESLFLRLENLKDIVKDVLNELQDAKTEESRIVLSSDILDMLLHAIGLERNGVDPKILTPFFDSGMERIRDLGIPLAIEIATLVYREHKAYGI